MPAPADARVDHCLARRRRGRSGGDDGFSVLEAVLVYAAVITVTFVVIQSAFIWHGTHVAQAAAQDGLRAARGFDATPEAGEQAARNYLKDVAPRLLRGATVEADQTPTSVRVTVQGDVLAVLSFTSFHVSEQASGPRELFVPPPGSAP
jgi:hypothetical protein